MKTSTFLIVLGAALAGATGYLLYHRHAKQQAEEYALSAAPVRKLVAELPEFSLADREGTMRSIRDWHGQSLVINYWATWCAPCRREIPLLMQLQRDHAHEGFQVIGVAVDFRDAVLEYAAEMKIDYPLLIGEQEALDSIGAFGIEAVGFPFTVFTDKAGRIVAAHMGELHADQAAVIMAAVRRVDRGEVTPLEARTQIEQALGREQGDRR